MIGQAHGARRRLLLQDGGRKTGSVRKWRAKRKQNGLREREVETGRKLGKVKRERMRCQSGGRMGH